MTTYTMLYIILTGLSLVACYAIGKSAPGAIDEVQRPQEKEATDAA